MYNAKIAENLNDREPLEPPINPPLIHMVPPFMGVKDSMFCLQINGEAVWESRKVYSYPRMTFDLLQRSILTYSYVDVCPSFQCICKQFPDTSGLTSVTL